MFLNQINAPVVKDTVKDWIQCHLCKQNMNSFMFQEHIVRCFKMHSQELEIRMRIEAGMAQASLNDLMNYRQCDADYFKATPEPKSGKSKRRKLMFAIFALFVGLVSGIVGMSHADEHKANDSNVVVSQSK